jgi:hypothetical protein
MAHLEAVEDLERAFVTGYCHKLVRLIIYSEERSAIGRADEVSKSAADMSFTDELLAFGVDDRDGSGAAIGCEKIAAAVGQGERDWSAVGGLRCEGRV